MAINTLNATSFKSVCYSYDYVMNLNYSYFSYYIISAVAKIEIWVSKSAISQNDI